MMFGEYLGLALMLFVALYYFLALRNNLWKLT